MSLMTLLGFRSKLLSSILEVVFLVLFAYVLILWSAFDYAAITGRAAEAATGRAWYNIVAWSAILPGWMYAVIAAECLAVGAIYLFSSPSRRLIVAFAELIFFCVLSYFFLLGVSAELPRWCDLRGWMALLPAWMYTILGTGYLGLITIYWLPGDEPQNRTEVRAFAIFVLAGLAVGGWFVNEWWASVR